MADSAFDKGGPFLDCVDSALAQMRRDYAQAMANRLVRCQVSERNWIVVRLIGTDKCGEMVFRGEQVFGPTTKQGAADWIKGNLPQ